MSATPPPVPDNPSDLTEQERIDLVKNDSVRRWGQIIMSFVLVGFSLAAVGAYAWYTKDPEFLKFLAYGAVGLVFSGIGAAYSIFGLGRTVGKRT